MKSPELAARLGQLADGQELQVGSGPAATFCINEPNVATLHARIACRNGRLLIRDMDTCEGTFVNQSEVRGWVDLLPGDRIRLGSWSCDLPGSNSGGSLSLPPLTEVALVDAVRSVRSRQGWLLSQKLILDQVSFTIRRGEFLGILGASGSGKSTLIRLLAGRNSLQDGKLLINGQIADASRLAGDRRIAYLPQDVVIHEELSCRAAIDYIARLKGIEANSHKRRVLVQRVLERVGLAEQLHLAIRQLSGGQRKRVALAAELLGEPELILLDEATSGLDPATEEEMMRLFQSLAREGRMVICITHFPGRLHLCDRLVYLKQGKRIFEGTSSELEQFFNVRTIEDVYVVQQTRTAAEWQSQFSGSLPGKHSEQRLVASRGVTQVAPVAIVSNSSFSPAAIWQFLILLSRYSKLQLTDFQNLVLLFLQAPVIGLMIAATFGSIHVPFAEQHASNTKEVTFVLVLAILWCAGTGSVREIVREQSILEHEQRFGVRLLPYLFSKIVFLGCLALLQTIALLATVKSLTHLTGPGFVQGIVLSATALAGVSLGLFVSAWARTSERAMTILPVLLIGQAILSGGLAQLSGWIQLAARVFVSAWWGLDGMRGTFGSGLIHATYPGAPGHFQPPILGSGGPLALDFLALGLQTAVLLCITWCLLALRRRRCS